MIAQPVVSNLSRNGTAGSATITVEDESYITKAVALSDFLGGSETPLGELTGSGVMVLDFSNFHYDTFGPFSPLNAPVARIIFQTRDGAGNFSEVLTKKICNGLTISNVVVSGYTRNGGTCSFTVSGIGGGHTAHVLWNDGTGKVADQIITNGANTITGLTPGWPYMFMVFENGADGEFDLSTDQFGDTIVNPPIPDLFQIQPDHNSIFRLED
jgi:hypothetical protein